MMSSPFFFISGCLYLLPLLFLLLNALFITLLVQTCILLWSVNKYWKHSLVVVVSRSASLWLQFCLVFYASHQGWKYSTHACQVVIPSSVHFSASGCVDWTAETKLVTHASCESPLLSNNSVLSSIVLLGILSFWKTFDSIVGKFIILIVE